MNPLLAAPLTALVLAVGIWINRRVRGWLPDDPPRPGRKQHDRPIPLAGIVLLPVSATWLLAERAWWLAAAAGIAAATGFWDDRGKEHGREPGWRTKAVGLAAAALAVAMATRDPLADPLGFAAVFAFAWIATNATNFLDNTDGVACALSAVTLLFATGGEGALGAAGAAAIGFLPFNWPRARVFLGDAGAYALGVLAAGAVAPHLGADGRGLLFVAVQLLDFAQVVLARLLLGLQPWVGDRRHLTHILQNLGLRRELVAPACALGAVLAALAARG